MIPTSATDTYKEFPNAKGTVPFVVGLAVPIEGVLLFHVTASVEVTTTPDAPDPTYVLAPNVRELSALFTGVFLTVHVIASVELANTPPAPAYTYSVPYVIADIALDVPLVLEVQVIPSALVDSPPAAAPNTYKAFPKVEAEIDEAVPDVLEVQVMASVEVRRVPPTPPATNTVPNVKVVNAVDVPLVLEVQTKPPALSNPKLAKSRGYVACEYVAPSHFNHAVVA
jgi:hypothetical protein